MSDHFGDFEGRRRFGDDAGHGRRGGQRRNGSGRGFGNSGSGGGWSRGGRGWDWERSDGGRSGRDGANGAERGWSGDGERRGGYRGGNGGGYRSAGRGWSADGDKRGGGFRRNGSGGGWRGGREDGDGRGGRRWSGDGERRGGYRGGNGGGYRSAGRGWSANGGGRDANRGGGRNWSADGDNRREGFGDHGGRRAWSRDGGGREHNGFVRGGGDESPRDANGRDAAQRRSYDERRLRRENEPALPDKVKAADLDGETLAALRGLTEENADRVARHLVMVGSLLDIDAEAAYRHAQAAVAHAGRIAPVREAAALAAYACGKYGEAMREVRAARRLGSSDSLRAVEADCERGLGKPSRALEIIAETDTAGMDVDEQAELVIVASGARADMEQYEAGLVLIEDFLATHQVADEATLARLLSVKADRLQELGREDDAAQVRAEAPAVPEAVSIVDLEEVAEADTAYVASDLHGSRKPLTEACDTLVLDLDGVCYSGTSPVAHAPEGIQAARAAGLSCAFVTNNASRSPRAVCEQLERVGIQADPGEVMTAAIDAAAILTESLPPKAKVLVIGGDGLREAVQKAGFEQVDSADDRPAAVIQGYDQSVGWKQLSEGAYAINNGAMFVATNLDASLPTERGLALGNGALVCAVERATGVQPKAGGKPFPAIYRRALDLVGGHKPLAVGDRLDTDIAGAKSAGYRCLHLLTGVSQARDVALAPRDQRPDFVGLDMRSVTEAQPGPVKNPTGEWTSGESAGFSVDEDGRVLRDGVALPEKSVLALPDYRAFVAAVWEARDNEVFVRLPKDIKVVHDASECPQQDAEGEPDGTGEVRQATPTADADARSDGTDGAQPQVASVADQGEPDRDPRGNDEEEGSGAAGARAAAGDADTAQDAAGTEDAVRGADNANHGADGFKQGADHAEHGSEDGKRGSDDAEHGTEDAAGASDPSATPSAGNEATQRADGYAAGGEQSADLEAEDELEQILTAAGIPAAAGKQSPHVDSASTGEESRDDDAR